MSLTLTSRVLRMHDSGATVLVFLPCPVTSRRSYIPSALFKTTNLKKQGSHGSSYPPSSPISEREAAHVFKVRSISSYTISIISIILTTWPHQNKSFTINSIHQLRHNPGITTIHISSSSHALYHKNAATNIFWNHPNYKSINHRHTPHTKHHPHTIPTW